jgi:hypothetical protein
MFLARYGIGFELLTQIRSPTLVRELSRPAPIREASNKIAQKGLALLRQRSVTTAVIASE